MSDIVHQALHLIQKHADGSATQRVWLVRDTPTETVVDALTEELGAPTATMLIPADVLTDAGGLAGRTIAL